MDEFSHNYKIQCSQSKIGEMTGLICKLIEALHLVLVCFNFNFVNYKFQLLFENLANRTSYISYAEAGQS